MSPIGPIPTGLFPTGLIPTGPIPLALLRGGHVAALLVLCGTLGFRALILPGLGAAPPAEPLRRLALLSAALALVLGAAWFLAEAAVVSGISRPLALLSALPSVLAYLGFARLLALRLALLILLLVCLALLPPGRLGGWRLGGWRLDGWRLGGLCAAAGAALGLQPWLGHAGAAGGRAGAILPWAELVHLLGAALWLGGLPALRLALPRLAQPGPAVHRFAAVALAAVVAIAASGTVQGWYLVGGIGRLTDTGYGRIVLLKLVLFAAALILALANRLVLSRRLDVPAARRRFAVAVTIEALAGLGIVGAAGFLAGLPPGTDRVGASLPWPLLALPAAALLLAALLLAWRLSRCLPARSLRSEGASP